MTAELARGNARELLLLACADPKTVEERVHEIYDWQIDRVTTPVTTTVTACLSLAAALFVSALKHELMTRWYWPVIGIAGAVIAAVVFGAFSYIRVGKLQRQYVVALRLVRDIAPPPP